MEEREFDWEQEDAKYKLGQEIEYLIMFGAEKIIIEKGKNIKVYYKESDN